MIRPQQKEKKDGNEFIDMEVQRNHILLHNTDSADRRE